jgi:biotin-dependent carboxylase-like uncharacterized protein
MRATSAAAIEIVEPGMATTLQDRGRPGYAHIGVPASGAVDPGLAGLVNRLVGNGPDATVIETCGGLTIGALMDILVATSAEPGPRSLRPGETCTVPVGSNGRLWHYVAVRGGIAAERVLGSASRDTLSKLGPPHGRRGDRFGLGPQPNDPIVADLAPLPAIADTIRISVGPRADWFTAASRDVLTTVRWSVTTSSRVGVRLSGATIERRILDELPSEGLVRGALQVPPDGNPVMMLADHPTTGGYPVIAVVHPGDVAAVAQHAAGTSIRFRLEV